MRRILETRPNLRICGKADNGTEAVSQAKTLRPDLIILDFNMPEMNGLEAAREILKFAPSMPILIFSIFASKRLVEEAHEIGVRGYIKKESNFETIIEAVEAVLRGESFFPIESVNKA